MRLAALIFAALLATPAAGQSSPAAEAYGRANRLFREHQYQQSMDALDEALRLDPKLVPALTLRARLAMAANRFDVARQSLESAIAADPGSWYARFLYGFLFYQRNEMPEAIASLEKAHALNPGDPPSTLYLGLAYESVGRNDEALGLYRRAVELEEAAGTIHADTILAQSKLLVVLGRFDEAAELARRAASVDPASRDPHFELARIAQKQQDPAKAIAEGETALKLHSGDTTDRQIHFLLAQAYREAGKEEEARRHAEMVRAPEGRKDPN